MQGLFINGRRPKSKKEVKELVAKFNEGDKEAGYSLVIEATSIFGNEYDGSLASAPTGEKITFVGPDPHNSRKFYGSLTYEKGKWLVR